MGYYTGDGFYVYEEADIADPGDGFSDLLNKAMFALPDAIRARVVAELAADPTIREAVEVAVEEFVAGLHLVQLSKCVHFESGVMILDDPGAPAATHYLIPDATGGLVARPTPFPTPSSIPGELNW